jgi:hypothetical protein
VLPGMRADLVLPDGDFEHDVSIVRRPEIIFKEGVGWDSGFWFFCIFGSSSDEV